MEIVSRRAALRLIAAGAGVTLVAACAPATTQPVPTTVVVSAPAKPVTGQPKLGGTLRFAATADVPNLDGHQRSAALQDTVWTVYDRLIQYDANGKAQPMLAESWDVSSDYKQVKFNLRKGVQFHNGRELTSDDVKWNILRVRDPKIGSGSYVTWSNWFTTIDTPDKATLILKSDASRPSMFDFFEWLNVVDPVTMQGPDAKTQSVGTGSFVFVEWKQGESLTFAKNKNYWQTGKPYIDGFVARVIEPKSAIVQLEAGAIDMVRTEAVDDIVRLKKGSGLPGDPTPVRGDFLRVRHQRHQTTLRQQKGAAGIQLRDRSPAVRGQHHARPGQTAGALLELDESGLR